MIEQLRMIAIKLGQERKNNLGDVKKYGLIQEILKNEQCFFQMNIETSYAILRDLGFKEEDLKQVYSLLIDYSNYKNNVNLEEYLFN